MPASITLHPHARSGDTLEVAATFTTPDAAHRLWWRLPASHAHAVTTFADPFVVGFTFLMLQTGGEVRVDAPVSPSLLRNLEHFMAIWRCWIPDSYRPVQISTREEAEPPPPRTADFVFPFSCGADSCFTMLRHHRQLVGRRTKKPGAAVVMHGFDIWLDQPHADDIYAGVLRNAHAMLDPLPVPVIPMTSNFHELPTTWAHSYGTQLVSGFRLLAAQYAGTFIPNNMPYAQPMHPWGSNPLSDVALSSDRFPVSDDGGECSRSEKLRLLASWPDAMANLRVCFANPNSHANCCVCEKCIRTMLAFRIAGLPTPAAFSLPITPGQVARVRFNNPINFNLWIELLTDARRAGLSRDPYIRAIAAALRRTRYKWAVQKIQRPFIPLRNSIRTIFRGSPKSERQRRG